MTGFEPATFCTQNKRATKLRYIPPICYFLICCNCILFVAFCLYLLILFTLFHLLPTFKNFNEIVTTLGK